MLARWGAAILVCAVGVSVAPPAPAAAQAQQQPASLGEAARRVREEKKQQTQKAGRLRTGDALPPASRANPNDLAAGSSVSTPAPEQPLTLGQAARRAREQKKLALRARRRWTEDDPLTLSGQSPALPQPEEQPPAAGRLSVGALPPTTSRVAPKYSGRAADVPPVATPGSREQVLQTGRTFMQQQKFADAIRLLESAQKDFPGDVEIRVELGRAYLYDGKDERAMREFTEVLHQEPSHRLAKLLMARALGYQSKYQASDELYSDLVRRNPADELASLGLIRNLLQEDRIAEARRQLELSLAQHPDSPRLREYRGLLEEGEDGSETPRSEKENRLQMSETYFTDSGGNRAWRSSQSAGFQFGSRLSMRLQAEQHLLWQTNGLRADVARVSDQFRLRVTPFLALGGGAGTVRFADRRTRSLFDGELELHPAKPLWISAGFSRVPVYPTVQAARSVLLAEGWHARLDWNPRLWRMNAAWSSLAYSDGNRDQRESLEVLRWIGSSRLAFAIGYRLDSLHFRRTLNHGYFDPSRYQSHLGTGGVNFGRARRFRAEYLVRVGAQAISPGPLRLAWELSLRNRLSLTQKWELGGDYYYLQLAQSSGAFTGQGSLLWIAYRF